MRKNIKKKNTKKKETILSLVRRHKLIAALLTFALCVISGLLVTLAIEKASDQRLNTMEIADTKVKINEHGFKNNDAANTPKVGAKDIPKQVTIDNKGETPVFIRAKIIPVFGRSGEPNDGTTSKNEREAMLEENTLLPLVVTDDATATGNFDVVIKGKSADWKKSDRDGYYYYPYLVKAGAATPDLFNTVDLPMTNIKYLDEYKKDFYFNIEVKVEAITIHDKAFQDAWNWPTSNSGLTGDDLIIYNGLATPKEKS